MAEWVDIHTGLGPAGIDVALCECPKDASLVRDILTSDPPIPSGYFDGVQELGGDGSLSVAEKINLRCHTDPPGGNVDRGKSDNQSSGYELTVGNLAHRDWISNFFDAKKTEILVSFTQEIGTQSGLKVARALMLENTEYWALMKDDTIKPRWKSVLKQAFYLEDDPEWKRRVVIRGLDVAEKLGRELEKKV